MSNYPGCGDGTAEPEPCMQPQWAARLEIARLKDRIKELELTIKSQGLIIKSLEAELDGPEPGTTEIPF